MSDELYWKDTLAWSESEANKLRRLAAGERVNDVDWEHVIEEIEDVGKNELRECTSLLRKAMEHLLKLAAWPGSTSVPHWRSEVRNFLHDASDAFSPSMRQRIDLGAIYRRALQVCDDAPDGQPPRALPSACPVTLDELLAEKPDIAALLMRVDRTNAGERDA